MSNANLLYLLRYLLYAVAHSKVNSFLRLCSSCRSAGMKGIVVRKVQKPVMASFGAIVSEKRKLLGISQELLAECVDISQESLSRMEKGLIAPRFERLQLFADALGCSIPDLFREQSEASEWAATMEKMLSPLSDCERKEVVAVVAKIVTLITMRRPAGSDTLLE